MQEKIEKVLEDRAEVEAFSTILGTLLVTLVEGGALTADCSTPCAPLL